ncbi:MAG: phosphoglycerate kinase, partial [Candidatus Liptonbacteria bacterium]
MIKYLRKTRKALLSGTALVRLDFNTKDEWRMAATIPTIKFLLAHANKIVIVSHRGRPEGAEKKLSLKKDTLALSKLIKHQVHFIADLEFGKIQETIMAGAPKSVFLLENLRFHSGEESNSIAFARQLADLADYYVNDAF